jgi:hypothetical protein
MRINVAFAKGSPHIKIDPVTLKGAHDDPNHSRSPAADLDICGYGRAVDGGLRVRLLGWVATTDGLGTRHAAPFGLESLYGVCGTRTEFMITEEGTKDECNPAINSGSSKRVSPGFRPSRRRAAVRRGKARGYFFS